MDRQAQIRQLAVAAAFVLAAALARAQQPAVPANQLVREAANKELHATSTRTERFMYHLRKVTPERTEDRQYVETERGTVGRLLLLNAKPLPPDLQAKEDARLQNLAQHPELQRDRERKQKEDEQRVTKMVGALPDAFNYDYDGVESSPYGELIRLRFQPNPNFDPPSRELKVYQGMQGYMWLRAQDHHLMRLAAQLFRDVDFGWGILGRLYKGGRFEVVQSDIGGGRWETTRMVLAFEGRAFIKPLRISIDETLSSFRRVPDGLSLVQGVEMLRKYNPNAETVADSHAASAPASAPKTAPAAATQNGGGSPPRR